jgi:hypothetical protein
MTLRALLVACRQRGIALTWTPDRLRYTAPAGTLTHDLKREIQTHKTAVLDVLWRLEAMRRWQPTPGAPVPVATPDQVGGPGHCHSCGEPFDRPDAYGRCRACWDALDLWLEEQAARADAMSEV